MIGKGYSDLRDLPLGGTWIGIIWKLACHKAGASKGSRNTVLLELQITSHKPAHEYTS
jgi:hypothetical protein